MNLIFTDEAGESYLYWQAYDKSILKKINALIKDVSYNHFVDLKPRIMRQTYFKKQSFQGLVLAFAQGEALLPFMPGSFLVR